MNGKEHLEKILAHNSGHCGFWHGCPNEKSRDYLFSHFRVKDDFELGLHLGSTMRWVMPEEFGLWKNSPGFDILGGQPRTSHGQPGVFATCEDPAQVENHPWPSVADCDFCGTLAEIDRTVAAGQAVLSGTWSCFFHVVCDYFGMENYFVKMYTDPEVVDAVTRRVVQFYLEANERLYALAGDKIDMFFFGNDFGSQLDLLISPESFDRFVMPYFRQFTDQAHSHGKKVLLHSCGSIQRVIPRLIEAGVDALHPIQSKARNMDAETLSSLYNGQIVFVGGVDTQQLLPFGTPAQVEAEVARLRGLFGPNYVVSPSHESILPGVSAENVSAMARAAAL